MIGEGDDMFFVGWECIAICDTSVVMSDYYYRIVHIFFGFKNSLVDFGWVYDGFGVFRADVKGAFCGEFTIGDSDDGGVFDATVIDGVFFIAGGVVKIGVDVTVGIFHIFNVTKLKMFYYVYFLFGLSL